MSDISKKHDKFMANKDKNKFEKESRGESPIRKISTNNPQNNKNTNVAKNSSSSIPATPGSKSMANKTLSRNSSVVPLSNSIINIDIINNLKIDTNTPPTNIKKLERSNSCQRNSSTNLQQMVNNYLKAKNFVIYLTLSSKNIKNVSSVFETD